MECCAIQSESEGEYTEQCNTRVCYCALATTKWQEGDKDKKKPEMDMWSYEEGYLENYYVRGSQRKACATKNRRCSDTRN